MDKYSIIEKTWIKSILVIYINKMHTHIYILLLNSRKIYLNNLIHFDDNYFLYWS